MDYLISEDNFPVGSHGQLQSSYYRGGAEHTSLARAHMCADSGGTAQAAQCRSEPGGVVLTHAALAWSGFAQRFAQSPVARSHLPPFTTMQKFAPRVGGSSGPSFWCLA